jgi:hypothetical protein
LSHPEGTRLVGGYAVAYHGYPRATKDMDIWVAPRIEIAQRLVAALQAFGVPDPQIDPAWFVDPESIFGIGNYPYRIEIFCAIPGVAFDDCYARKIIVRHVSNRANQGLQFGPTSCTK